MAGAWIKMRTGLATSPKVVRIASALNADRLRVVGGLHAVWSLFDEHSEDGRLAGYTADVLDSLIGWAGFAAEMAAVDWLVVGAEGLALPRFDTHNGQSAKRRAQEADRKRASRESSSASASDADEKRTREEKRRGEEEQKQGASPAGDAPPVASDPIPYQAIVDCYNRTMVNLPKVRELTGKRRTLVRSAWQANPKRRGMRFWSAYFELCQGDDFLNGTGPYGNGHEGWRPTFDYLLRADVVTKTVERALDAHERAKEVAR